MSTTTDDDWSNPVSLGPMVNSSADECYPSLSSDGLEFYFCSNRPGGIGGYDLWVTTRATTSDDWGVPVNLGPPLNSSAWETCPNVSTDGSSILFVVSQSARHSGGDIWQAPILPIIDLNDDEVVDGMNLHIMLSSWGSGDPLRDIGPLPWGDGVVDEEDLAILMKSLATPEAHALNVPYDVVLTWTAPSIAESFDVYLGTSPEAVRAASRTNPEGVLVSLGQTVTFYNPERLLEFSQTYYWRIDTILGSSEAAIGKGSVLSFTTEPFAHAVQNIIATASSSWSGSGPDKTVDGSGLDENDGHSTDSKQMWQSTSAPPQWIQYKFDQIHALHELWVWNSNQKVEATLGFGARTVKIEYSVDGTTWTLLEGVPEFGRAPGESGYVADTKVSFAGVSAKYVKLTIEKAWGALPTVGLSEVRFNYIPDRPPAQP